MYASFCCAEDNLALLHRMPLVWVLPDGSLAQLRSLK